MESEFQKQIHVLLEQLYGNLAQEVLEKSLLLQYLVTKTRSANRGSKSRASFGNIYAIYVVIENYLAGGYDRRNDYRTTYEGASYTPLRNRMRSPPFGEKLQNHGLNHRLNEEFRKFFPTSRHVPLSRNLITNRYWINENLLRLRIGDGEVNIATTIIAIIDLYISTKRSAFERFIATCRELQSLPVYAKQHVVEFIDGLLAVNTDARLFEIASYAILKYYYVDHSVYWGYVIEEVREDNLVLYKTGRTNANDGGIDFVMRPLGRFFQVTETSDVRKYFLDIDKIERYPITFVIKSEDSVEVIIAQLREAAMIQYGVAAVVDQYMNCIEEIINLPILRERFSIAVGNAHRVSILKEIIRQSQVEFNWDVNSG